MHIHIWVCGVTQKVVGEKITWQLEQLEFCYPAYFEAIVLGKETLTATLIPALVLHVGAWRPWDIFGHRPPLSFLAEALAAFQNRG